VEYRPDFSKPAWRAGADAARAVVSGDDGVRAADGEAGEIVWTIRSPYVLVGGKLEIEGDGAAFEISWDGKTWEKAGPDLDKFFFRPSARLVIPINCAAASGGDARLGKLAIVNDVQMAPLSLPEMGVGENRFAYSDESTGPRRVRITHEWVERSKSAPPAAPVAPVSPTGSRRDGRDKRRLPVVARHGSQWRQDRRLYFELPSRPEHEVAALNEPADLGRRGLARLAALLSPGELIVGDLVAIGIRGGPPLEDDVCPFHLASIRWRDRSHGCSRRRALGPFDPLMRDPHAPRAR